MSADLFNAELEAQRSLLELLEKAQQCKMLYERAHMALPEPLKRVLGLNSNGAKSGGSYIAPPDRPSLPAEGEADWIAIRIPDATPTSLALAILQQAKRPVPAKDVIEQITSAKPEVTRGSIANIGTRLTKQGLIRRTSEGWELVSRESAPLLHKELLWGPKTIFGKYELAAHRREAILHILSSFPTGLQTVQLVGELRKCSWVQAPINKDLVKEDMEALQADGRVKRRGNSKKWEIVEVAKATTP